MSSDLAGDILRPSHSVDAASNLAEPWLRFSVWPAAPALSRHLETSKRFEVQGSRVLELGAGFGLVGMATAVLGARSVCLTDRLIPRLQQPTGDLAGETPGSGRKGGQQQLAALRSTLQGNQAAGNFPADCAFAVEELSFGDESVGQKLLDDHGPFDLILGSDITYFSPALPELMVTLKQMAGSRTLVLLGHSQRRQGLEEELVAKLEEAGFAVNRHGTDTGAGAAKVVLIECRQRQQQRD